MEALDKEWIFHGSTQVNKNPASYYCQLIFILTLNIPLFSLFTSHSNASNLRKRQIHLV